MEERSGPYTASVPSPVSPTAPVVMILGWVGAGDKALGKYAQLLGSWGYPTTRSVVPSKHVLLGNKRAVRAHAKGLLDFALAQGLVPSRPLVLYSFSNGGAYVMNEIRQLCLEDKRYDGIWQRVLACIFDSAPAFGGAEVRRRVFETITPPGLARAVGGLQLRLLEFVEGFRGNALNHGFRKDMLELGAGPPRVPLLYLFSDADELTEAPRVKALLDQKIALGQDVTFKCWPDSAHVMHMRQHPDEYIVELARFLQRAAPAKARARF